MFKMFGTLSSNVPSDLVSVAKDLESIGYILAFQGEYSAAIIKEEPDIESEEEPSE